MVVEVPCSAVGSVPLFSWPLEEHGGPPSAEGIAPTASVPPFAFGVKGAWTAGDAPARGWLARSWEALGSGAARWSWRILARAVARLERDRCPTRAHKAQPGQTDPRSLANH